MGEAGLKIAFGVIDWDSGMVLEDPDYVEWEVSVETRKNFMSVLRQQIAMHKCTDEDLHEFNVVHDQ